MTTEADKLVRNYSEAAESSERMKRDIEKSAETAQREKEEAIAKLFEMAGKVKATTFQKSQSEFFALLMLKQVKDSKEYRSKAGMTWEQFCEYVGVDRRRVDEQLLDLKPFRAEFLADFANFSGVEIGKIKYLGMAVNEKVAEIAENAIVYNGETIPLDAEHKDDIQAILENLEASHKKEKEELEATVKAKDRIVSDKEKVINNLSKDLKRLERTADLTELTPEEQDAVNLLTEVQLNFLQGISDVKKKIEPNVAPEIALRSYYYLLILMSKACLEERMRLEEAYREAESVPWEIREEELAVIPEGVIEDNQPTFVGRGIGKKVREKLDQRNKKTNKGGGNEDRG